MPRSRTGPLRVVTTKTGLATAVCSSISQRELLARQASVEGDAAHYEPAQGEYGWLDNRYEMTAMALQALAQADPKAALVPKLVRYLVRQRRGGRWDTTKDTAAVVMSLVTLV